MHKFKIVERKNDKFGAQFVYNSEVMMWSESYRSKASAIKCIESIKKNAPDAPVADLTRDEDANGYHFEIVGSKNDQFFVRFVASNGETMVISETYASKSSAQNCIDSVKKNTPGAPTEDETGVFLHEYKYPETVEHLAENTEAHRRMVHELVAMVAQAHADLSRQLPNDPQKQAEKKTQQQFLETIIEKLWALNKELEGIERSSDSHKRFEVASAIIVDLGNFLREWAEQNPKIVKRMLHIGGIGATCVFLRYCGIPTEISAALAIYLVGGQELIGLVKSIVK